MLIKLINFLKTALKNWADQDTAPDYLVMAIKTTGGAIVGLGLLRIFYEMGTNPEAFDSVGGYIASTFLVLRQEISHRGGGIEISLDNFGFQGEKMCAYQNYLGGGMLARIGSDCTIKNWTDDKRLIAISEKLKKYFHELTVHDDEWEWETSENNQLKPYSAF